MLVDDNRMFLQVVSEFLEADGEFDVVGTAEDGAEALALLGEFEPDVILIDLAMPGVPGLEAIPLLRDSAPGARIIALTAMSNNHFRRAALVAGADDFLAKSRMRSDLFSVIRRFTQNQGPVEPAIVPEGVVDTPRILVMEDEPDLRRLYTKALQHAGYETHSAATLAEARNLVDQVRFDLLLCDIHMGQERGTDLLRDYSAELFSSGAQVVMISGEARYRGICEEMGVDFFLEKPVAMSTLLALADRLTARHALY
jgi:DNA-binding response OmpR family regulator